MITSGEEKRIRMPSGPSPRDMTRGPGMGVGSSPPKVLLDREYSSSSFHTSSRNLSATERFAISIMSSPNQSSHYRPIRRIRQACQNCRRKKARCPGQRPSCSFCLRLGQPCSYSEDDAPNSPTAMSSGGGHQWKDQYRRRAKGESEKDFASSIASMEMKLEAVANSVKTLESTLAAFANQLPKMVSPSSNHTDSNDTTSNHPMDPYPDPPSLPYSTVPPIGVIREAADLYFRYCHNQPYSLFHEASFREKIELNEVPAHLLFAFLASTVRYSSNPFFEDKNAAVAACSAQSWKGIVMPWNGLQSEAELSILQTILLLAIIDYTDGRTQASWIKVGLAIRLSQDFRLMVEPDPSLPAIHQEERRRVFWSFYLCDKLISCGRERPATILDDQCRLQLPGDENKWRMGEYQKTPTLEQFVDVSSTSNIGELCPFAITVLMTSLLGRSAQYALGEQEEQTSAGKLVPWNPHSKYSSIHSMILQHESELGLNEPLANKISRYCLAPDGSIDQHRAAPQAFAHALFYLCQCLLYHPLLLRQRLARIGQRTPNSFLVQTFNACHDAASSLSQLMGDVKSLQSAVLTTSYDPFYGYCNMVAGVIHAIFLQSGTAASRDMAAACYEASLQNLKDLSQYWKSCSMMRDRLEDFRANSDRYGSLIDPTLQDMDLSPNDANDLIECLDYARMSTTPRRRSQGVEKAAGAGGSPGDLPALTQLPSPFFEELMNLLPISYSRPMTPRHFDNMVFGPQMAPATTDNHMVPGLDVGQDLKSPTKGLDGSRFDLSPGQVGLS